MEAYEHFHLIGAALWRWLVTRFYDALLVGLLWFAGLWFLQVPWSPLWAVLAGLLQFIPNFGLVLSLIGPAFAAALSGGSMRLVYVLILYGAIAMMDGLLIQPLLMKGIAKVPFWISLVAPIALALVFNVWGLLLAPPLLAVLYAYRWQKRSRAARHSRGNPK